MPLRSTRRPVAGAAILAALSAPALLHAQTIERQVPTRLTPPPATPGALPVVGNMTAAIAAAYRNNPQILAERARTRAADERVAQARSGYGPTLTFSGRYGYAYDRIELAPNFPDTRRGFAGTGSLILSQPIFSSGRLRGAEQNAVAGVAFAREALRYQESLTLLEAYSAYAAVQRDRYLLDIANRNFALLRQQSSDSNERFQTREITKTDLDQVQTRYNIGLATIENARSALSSSEARFLNVVGAMPAATLAPIDVPARMPASLADALAVGESNSPLLLAAHARERISRAQLTQAKADRGPVVALEGEASYGGVTVYDNDRNQKLLRGGVSLQMPLIDSGLRAARVREAVETNAADQALVDQALRDLRADVQSNWNVLISRLQSIGRLRTAVEVAKSAYDGAVIQQQAGAATTLDVLDLLRDLLNVRSQLATTITDAETARFTLLALMGELEATKLGVTVEPFQPEEHLRRTYSKGNVPPLTQVSSTLDSINISDKTAARPYQDPAASLRPPGLTAELSPNAPIAPPEE